VTSYQMLLQLKHNSSALAGHVERSLLLCIVHTYIYRWQHSPSTTEWPERHSVVRPCILYTYKKVKSVWRHCTYSLINNWPWPLNYLRNWIDCCSVDHCWLLNTKQQRNLSA
jgi:hypothetical protein